MRVALISVNDVIYDFGLRSLAAYLKNKGHDVDLVFLTVPERELSGQILLDVLALCRRADLVGISVLTHSLGKAITLTEILRLGLPAVRIVWGGIHVTGSPDECLEHADIVCLGEGEETLLEIVERCREENRPLGIPGTWEKSRDGAVSKNAVRPLIEDLESLPPPDYSLDSDYVTHEGSLVTLDPDLFKKRLLYYRFNQMGHVYVTMTSRGCPFNCTYCCNNVLRRLYAGKGKIVRKRSLSNVIRELRAVKERFPFITSVLFEDDSFLFRSTPELVEFAEAYRRDIALPFGIEMHPNEASFDKLAVLKTAGLALVHTGIQSGDERIRRELYRRNTPESKILACNKVLTRLSILHKYDIIVDMPFPGDACASLRLLRRFRPMFSLNLYSIRLYPGLDLRALLLERGHETWVNQNDRAMSYSQILSDEPCVFVLKLYEAFPPKTIPFFLVHRIINSRPALLALRSALLRRAVRLVMRLLK